MHNVYRADEKVNKGTSKPNRLKKTKKTVKAEMAGID